LAVALNVLTERAKMPGRGGSTLTLYRPYVYPTVPLREKKFEPRGGNSRTLGDELATMLE
jgi:hypothetical protein